MILIYRLELELIHQQNEKIQEENKEAPRVMDQKKKIISLALLRR